VGLGDSGDSGSVSLCLWRWCLWSLWSPTLSWILLLRLVMSQMWILLSLLWLWLPLPWQACAC
jgi:hypothetical protein